ncbi:rho-related GTP-binding protein RhoF isoform 1-T1 [Thomomys bottae]
MGAPGSSSGSGPTCCPSAGLCMHFVHAFGSLQRAPPPSSDWASPTLRGQRLGRPGRTLPSSATQSLVPGQEDYDRLRPLSYQNAHLVLICYDVMNPTSYDNVLIKWFPEVTHFCRGAPMVLIGCKTDLRKDKEHLRKLRAAQLEPITYTQGLSACEQIQAALYLECSAKFRENVEDVFREAAKVALRALKKAQRQKKQRLCLLL